MEQAVKKTVVKTIQPANVMKVIKNKPIVPPTKLIKKVIKKVEQPAAVVPVIEEPEKETSPTTTNNGDTETTGVPMEEVTPYQEIPDTQEKATEEQVPQEPGAQQQEVEATEEAEAAQEVEATEETEAKKQKRTTNSFKSGLVFPVARIRKRIGIYASKDVKIYMNAAIFLAAVIEYLVRELCDIAGSACEDKTFLKTLRIYQPLKRISPVLLWRSAMNDSEGFMPLFNTSSFKGGFKQYQNADITNRIDQFRRTINSIKSKTKLLEMRAQIRDIEKDRKAATEKNGEIIRLSYSSDKKDVQQIRKHFSVPDLVKQAKKGKS